MILDDLKGKRVLVTGSSSGIGAAAATAFGEHGSFVVVHYFKNEAGAREVAAKIEQDGGKVALVSGDLRNPETAASVVRAAAEAAGGLDILVNNAGGLAGQSKLDSHDNALLDETLDLNVRSLLAVTAAAHPYLKQAGGGSIINVGSIAARNGGRPGSAFYAAAKAFVHSLTRSMATEFAADNIRVNTIAPGVILTPFHDGTPKERLEAVRSSVPLGRLGEAEECAGAILYLASNAMSGYATGDTIDVNGGRLMA
ncbi:SDR family NAD(P)-dependent oxidoreductase [Microbaculum marinum]|uniref:SDR family NAD(P)-dependent oxidoreductase n=1 Tax=Microbaculum marinum TaxID=1764581 RepID=A0AAW9RRK4_9HYPH